VIELEKSAPSHKANVHLGVFATHRVPDKTTKMSHRDGSGEIEKKGNIFQKTQLSKRVTNTDQKANANRSEINIQDREKRKSG